MSRHFTELPPANSIPALTKTQASAVKALMLCTADQETQRIATEWIVKDLCCIGGISFRPGDRSSADFIEGRRFIAATLIHIMEQPIKNLKVTDDRHATRSTGEQGRS